MSVNTSKTVEIISENAGEIRVYMAQYYSEARGRRVREYADAVSEADLATMSEQDQARVRYYGRLNVTPDGIEQSHCSPDACKGCQSPCPKPNTET